MRFWIADFGFYPFRNGSTVLTASTLLSIVSLSNDIMHEPVE
jgi:hypothetical protein